LKASVHPGRIGRRAFLGRITLGKLKQIMRRLKCTLPDIFDE
jgi:hypothetical protein